MRDPVEVGRMSGARSKPAPSRKVSSPKNLLAFLLHCLLFLDRLSFPLPVPFLVLSLQVVFLFLCLFLLPFRRSLFVLRS